MNTKLSSELNVTNNCVNSSEEEKKRANNARQFTADMFKIVRILNNQGHKALILYLIPEQEKPKQNLIRLLRDMAAQNFLCFVCCHSLDQNSLNRIETLGQNLFLVEQGLCWVARMWHGICAPKQHTIAVVKNRNWI